MDKPIIIAVDDDPEVVDAVARDLRLGYGEHYQAPCLVKVAIDRDSLAQIAADLTAPQFIACMHWLVATLDLRALMEETRRGAQRISEIMRAIVIRTRRELDCAVVEIIDNGPGIAPDVMPHLFEPFFTTKPPGQGTGLGLDISYQTVVNRHGGAIHVKSHPGETTFQVRLPLAPQEPARDPPP
ncbi:ATP-binding protein [Cupriavidus sp. 2TAF22]|uniref:sensor histidine kinase n=1 Tax=unclassified Cupriavidus TaxID=2640874 RepID=UPI003F93529A